MNLKKLFLTATAILSTTAMAYHLTPEEKAAIMATDERVIMCFTEDYNYNVYKGSSTKIKRAKKKSLKNCQSSSLYPNTCQVKACKEYTKKCIAKDNWGERFLGYSPDVKRAKGKALNKCHTQSYTPESCKLKRCKVVSI